MKAAWSIGANNPLRLRLLVMTCVTPRLTSPSAGVPATKFGIAIGSGAKSPSVMGTRFDCASAPRGEIAEAAPSAAIPEMIWRRLGRSSVSRSLSWSVIGHFNLGSNGAMPASDRLFLEDRHEGLPFLEELRRQIV